MWRRGDGYLQAKERGLRKVNPADTLISDVYPPELSENEFLLFKLPSLQYFVENPPKRILQGYSSQNFFNSSSRKKHKCPTVEAWFFSYASLPVCPQEERFHMVSFFCQILVLYFSKFPHFIKFLHCITFIIRKKRRQKEQLW